MFSSPKKVFAKMFALYVAIYFDLIQKWYLSHVERKNIYSQLNLHASRAKPRLLKKPNLGLFV